MIAAPTPEIIAEWTSVPYRVDDPTLRARWEGGRQFGKALVQGIKVDSAGAIYITSARWGGPDVPATVSRMEGRGREAVLVPFPSEALNDVANPRGLKAVLGFEIDRDDVMWILDQGHIAGQPNAPGDAKIVLWDIRTGRELQRIEFTHEEADFRASFLNDIVVDNDTGFAYVADSGIFSNPLKGGLLIYDSNRNRARRILDSSPFTNDEPHFFFNCGALPVLKNQPMLTGADGIALSGDKATLYWTNLTGNTLYSLPTALLRDFSVPESEIGKAVRIVSVLPSNTDGMTCDRDGNLYMTALMLDGLMKRDAATGRITRFLHHKDMIWPDTLAWGPDGALYCLSNNLNVWVDGDMAFDGERQPNFRVWKIPGVGRSYTAP